MKLDRNIDGNEGRGKYALLKIRQLALCERPEAFAGYGDEINQALETLEDAGILDWGSAGTEAEFFVIRLKDEYARPALLAYGAAARADDPEYADEIDEMAMRSGPFSPWCKRPD